MTTDGLELKTVVSFARMTAAQGPTGRLFGVVAGLRFSSYRHHALRIDGVYDENLFLFIV
jgi:hypothetical protein